MFVDECEWISQILAGLEINEITPVLNVGSSTFQYRTYHEPYIQKVLFGPLEARGAKIYHFDQKQAEGVDLVGDLLDPSSIENLKAVGAKLILCNSFLTHVHDLDQACANLQELVTPGGFLCVTTPQIYPYCTDPWDSGFRPSISQLAARFPKLKVLHATSVVQQDSSHFKVLLRSPKQAVKFFLRLLAPFWKPRNWVGQVSFLPIFFRHYTATCLLLRCPL